MPGGANKKSLRQARSRKPAEEEAAPAPVAEPTNTQEKEESSEEECVCTICVEPISFFALGSACHHKSICSLCAIRQRKLYGKKECAFCKVQKRTALIYDLPSTH